MAANRLCCNIFNPRRCGRSLPSARGWSSAAAEPGERTEESQQTLDSRGSTLRATLGVGIVMLASGELEFDPPFRSSRAPHRSGNRREHDRGHLRRQVTWQQTFQRSTLCILFPQKSSSGSGCSRVSRTCFPASGRDARFMTGT